MGHIPVFLLYQMKARQDSKSVWDSINGESAVDADVSKKIWSAVDGRIRHATQRRKNLRMVTLGLLPLLGIGLWYAAAMFLSRAETVYSTDRLAKTVELPDGTQVSMQPHSRMVLAEDFLASDRKISYSGKGFFAVAKDANKPFRIDAGSFDLEVLGTKFQLTGSGEINEVRLLEGKVKIRKGGKETILMPEEVWAQEADKEPQHFVTALGKRKFAFEREELQAVVAQLESTYAVEIKFPQSLAEASVSGTFTGNLSEIVTIVAFPFDLQVIQVNKKQYRLK